MLILVQINRNSSIFHLRERCPRNKWASSWTLFLCGFYVCVFIYNIFVVKCAAASAYVTHSIKDCVLEIDSSHRNGSEMTCVWLQRYTEVSFEDCVGCFKLYVPEKQKFCMVYSGLCLLTSILYLYLTIQTNIKCNGSVNFTLTQPFGLKLGCVPTKFATTRTCEVQGKLINKEMPPR